MDVFVYKYMESKKTAEEKLELYNYNIVKIVESIDNVQLGLQISKSLSGEIINSTIILNSISLLTLYIGTVSYSKMKKYNFKKKKTRPSSRNLKSPFYSFKTQKQKFQNLKHHLFVSNLLLVSLVILQFYIKNCKTL